MCKGSFASYSKTIERILFLATIVPAAFFLSVYQVSTYARELLVLSVSHRKSTDHQHQGKVLLQCLLYTKIFKMLAFID